MTDVTAALAGHTKKYNIPLSHFEHKYIQNCTNGKELEKIYKELIGGEVGSFPDLEKLTLNRIRDVKPNSQILRKDEAPLDRSALPASEQQQLDDFLNRMKEVNKTSSTTTTTTTEEHHENGVNSVPIRNKSIEAKSITPTPAASVINKNGKQKRIVPRSYDEWGKLDQKLSQQTDSGSEHEGDRPGNKADLPATVSRPADPQEEKAQRLRSAEEHRLKGNAAFKSNSYQQAIDHYTNSIAHDDTNSVIYMNRAIAHYKLNNYDASMSDCSRVLASDPRHIKALFRRASCCRAKQQYDEAKRDLENLLSVDPDNVEAKNLLETIPAVQKPKGVRIPITEDDGDDGEEEQQVTVTQAPAPTSIKIPILEVEEEEETEAERPPSPLSQQQPAIHESTQSMNIDIPQKTNPHARPCIESQDASPAMFDHHLHHRDDMHHFQQTIHSQLSNLNADEDDDDDMVLGDEAGGDLIGNMSDDDGHVSRSLNVSPTMEDDGNEEVPELVDQQSFRTRPLTPPTRETKNTNSIDQSIAYSMNETYHGGDFSRTSNSHHYDDDNRSPPLSNSRSSYKPTSAGFSSNTFDTNERSSSAMDPHNDQISSSSFSPIIQSWLRDLVKLQLIQRPSSLHGKPWTRSSRPYELDRLQRDIDRFNRSNDCRNAIEAAKKMLKNGLLNYHEHADHIVNTLMVCAQCNAKLNNHVLTIQYTTEALQYNKMDANVLICRARAFEAEKFLLFSYADYTRIPSTDYNYALAQRGCDKLIPELEATEGENWREKLPKDINDDERYLAFIKSKTTDSDDNQYERCRERGNQLYMDACFVLAIQWYTRCIELKANVAFLYSNRAACYLKAFEPYKAIDDSSKALELDPKNVRAFYRKACAYKMSGDKHSYESTLEDLLKLEPNNQTILTEYYSSRRVPMPRERRRLRVNPVKEKNVPPTTVVTSSPSPDVSQTKPTNVIEQISLTYTDLEEIRAQNLVPFSTNLAYQFTSQLSSLKPNDTKGQCSLVLRLPSKGLFKLASAASHKLVETIARGCRTMVFAEKRYQQENKSSILPFSYATFCFNLLIELTALPRIESAVAMIDEHARTSLDDVLVYYASIPSLFHDVQKLDRLRK